MTIGIGPGAISIRGSIDGIGSALPRVAKARAGGVAAMRAGANAVGPISTLGTASATTACVGSPLSSWADVVMTEIGRRDARDGAWAAAPRTSAENGR